MSFEGAEYWLRWGGTRVELLPGSTATIGRSRRSDLMLPSSDDFVSRHAATVVVTADHIEIRNTSDKREVRIRPPVGEDVVVRPLSGTTSRGLPSFAIVVAGLHNVEYVIEARGPVGEREHWSTSVSMTSGATIGRPFALTTAESAALVALCRPMLVRNGAAAVPATYAAIAKELTLQPAYVRKVLGRLRDRLSEAGVPGLAYGGDGAADYRLALARYAIDVGWAYGDE